MKPKNQKTIEERIRLLAHDLMVIKRDCPLSYTEAFRRGIKSLLSDIIREVINSPNPKERAKKLGIL